MTAFAFFPWAEFGLFLLLPALLCWRWSRRQVGHNRIEIHPRFRSVLHRLGLTAPNQFFSLSSLTISGHPDRNVSRVTLGEGPEALIGFLKHEYRVSWLVRLRNWFAGFGLVSRSLRECRTLQALQREGLPGPDWIAAGEDDRGRAFLLLHELPGACDLWQALRQATEPRQRRRLARAIGETVARLHHKGFSHPDLYANHVLVGLDGAKITILDWQRTRPGYKLDWRQRGRDLAGLHITVASHLAGEQERWHCLWAYLKESARLTAGTGQPVAHHGLFRRRVFALLLRGLRRKPAGACAAGTCSKNFSKA